MTTRAGPSPYFRIESAVTICGVPTVEIGRPRSIRLNHRFAIRRFYLFGSSREGETGFLARQSGQTDDALDEGRLRSLIDVGRTLVSNLDLELVLQGVLDAARDLTEARYAALGILDERREGLERFITSGVDDRLRDEIGDLPRGRGVLGVLIRDPQPLRLDDV